MPEFEAQISGLWHFHKYRQKRAKKRRLFTLIYAFDYAINSQRCKTRRCSEPTVRFYGAYTSKIAFYTDDFCDDLPIMTVKAHLRADFWKKLKKYSRQFQRNSTHLSEAGGNFLRPLMLGIRLMPHSSELRAAQDCRAGGRKTSCHK